LLIPQPGDASIYIRPGSSTDSTRITVGEIIDALQDIICRLECRELRQAREIDAVSLRPPSSRVAVPDSIQMVKGDVQRIAINAMPEPDEGTSLEQILDFRSDPDAKGKMLALRRWMSGMVKASATPREIVEELEWLLHEYQAHMRLHRMKIRRGIWETIIVGGAEIAEDLVKIRWGKLAKVPFSISAKRIELLEAEQSAPGKEIAYIARVRGEFGIT